MMMNLGQEDELTLSVETGEDDIQGKLANIINTDSVREGRVRSDSNCIEYYLVLKLEMQLFKYIKYLKSASENMYE